MSRTKTIRLERVTAGIVSGEFSSPVIYPLPSLSFAVVVADLTGDGIPDIVGSGTEFAPGLYLLRGMPDGGFESAQNGNGTFLGGQMTGTVT